MPPTMVDSIEPIRAEIAAGNSVCVIEESGTYPGELSFFAPDQDALVRANSEYISSYSLLGELFMLDPLLERLDGQGRKVFCMPSAQPILENHRKWSEPLEVDGLDLGPGKALFPYQQFSIRRALSSGNRRLQKDGFFYNFGTGTGKSVIAAAGAQEMFNRDEIDLVLFFTIPKQKINIAREIEGKTRLTAEVIEGAKDRRCKRYAESTANVIMLNFERAHHDYDEIAAMVEGRRVLVVADEVQKVLRADNAANLARKAMDRLMKVPQRTVVWPMSASIVKASPLRYHDVYTFATNKNPLGTRKDFIERYCSEIKRFRLPNGAQVKSYEWNLPELVEIRHRVSRVTQAVRKTDPGVREFFKGMTTQVVTVQTTKKEKQLAQIILELASADPEANTVQYYNCLRYICNTPAALKYSESPVAQQVVEKYPELVETPSSKFEMIVDKIEQIRDQGDQVVIFTQWTYLTLFLLAKELKGKGIRYVTHYGTGMTPSEAQSAQDRFKADPEITVFLSSDAGAYGLNFQNARYVINVESPYDPDILMQRNDRIDRADSYLDGLTAYIYVVEGSVEENIWAINEARRAVSAATQGTTETLSRFSAEELQMSESQAMHMLMRGGLARR